jgi:hypothetical protein
VRGPLRGWLGRRQAFGFSTALVVGLAACSSAQTATTTSPEAIDTTTAGISYTDTVTASEPVERWSMDGEEPGGIGAYRGTVTTGEAPAVGEGSSVYLDGQTGHVWVSGAAEEPAQSLALDQMTVELWFRAEELPVDGVMHLARWRWYGWGIYIADGRLSAELWEDIAAGGTGREPEATTLEGPTLSTNRWYHVALTRDVRTTRLYVDGLLTDEVDAQGVVYYVAIDPEDDCCGIGGGMAFGRDADVDGNYLAGWLDEIAIYPTALPSATIVEHRSFGSP